jgi:signal transduction histidine kinase
VSHKTNLSQIDLMGTIVHDLKTPIAAIKSYADLIEQSGELNERQTRYLHRILAATQNMTNLVNDLLDLVWIESGMELKKMPCNVRDLARAQIHILDDFAAESGVTLSMIAGDDLMPVQADERRLNQVLGNLIVNGIKYNRPHGTVTVHIKCENDLLCVKIEDTGMGIAAEDLPHVFERFFRTASAEASRIEGTGLGLAIAKAIVERHGGTISVESAPGKGSTFWFTLPIR